MMTWIPVCDIDDVVPERGAACLLDNQQVALFRVSDDVVLGVGNHDPFSGANVISRGIVGTSGDRWFVASPMYKHRFDLRTGTCLDDATKALPVFRVKVEDGRILVAKESP